MNEHYTHNETESRSIQRKSGKLRALVLAKSLMTPSKLICRKMSCSMLISVRSFRHSCVMIVCNLFLKNFSLLNDLSPLQLLIMCTRYTRRAVSTSRNVSGTPLSLNQSDTLPSFPKQNIAMNTGIHVTDLAVCKCLTQIRS